MTAARLLGGGDGRLYAAACYLGIIAAGNLAWESAHIPLYTIWHDGTAGEIVFAIVHCTAGDVMIAGAALLGAVLVAGRRVWPHGCHGRVAALAVAGGVLYTVFSEWLNTTVQASWAYTPLMPTLPVLGTGLSPLLQWIVIPLAAFGLVRRARPAVGQP